MKRLMMIIVMLCMGSPVYGQTITFESTISSGHVGFGMSLLDKGNIGFTVYEQRAIYRTGFNGTGMALNYNGKKNTWVEFGLSFFQHWEDDNQINIMGCKVAIKWFRKDKFLIFGISNKPYSISLGFGIIIFPF